MIYPQFLKDGDLIAIPAPSAGVGHKLERFDASLKILQKSFRTRETESVRVSAKASASKTKRAKEVMECFDDPESKLVLCAAGGDFMGEILPYLDFEKIAASKKWAMGASDPTNLLYPLTTKYDVATLYGYNAGGFLKEDKPALTALSFIKGELSEQKSYETYIPFIDEVNDRNNEKPVVWKGRESSFSGRMIGGCLDVIDTLIGTPYDGGAQFIEKYKNDGIIWYFDVFGMSSLGFYLSLLKMKNCGYFKYCRGVIVSRVAFENREPGLSYGKALNKALGSIPYIYEADIGHTSPAMTLINGAMADVSLKNGKGSISFRLE